MTKAITACVLFLLVSLVSAEELQSGSDAESVENSGGAANSVVTAVDSAIGKPYSPWLIGGGALLITFALVEVLDQDDDASTTTSTS